MRNYMVQCSALLLLTAVSVSCNRIEDVDPVVTPATTQAYLRLKADGVQWSATTKINTWGAERILLAGKGDGDYPVVSANVPYSGAAGTFDITSEKGSFFHYQDANGKLFQITSTRGSGSITVTQRDVVNGQVLLTGKFEGTAFTIDGKDSVKITEGEFYDDMLE
ncbi:MAG: hypothetical protein H3C54_01305 [Taibaiella sp.]|nr:hypothetical protein [Taibaiella sp.]